MVRILLPVLLIVVPLVSYMIWLKMAERNKELRAQGRLPHWREAPWTLIILITIACIAALLAVLAIFDGAEPRSAYTPPSYVDGEIVPSQVDE
jgi:hypothetical protein